MQIIEVKNKADKNKFYKLPNKIYKDDSNWIPPLIQDIKKIFNPKKNKHFKNGVLSRFILERNNEVIGRVAVFIHYKTAEGYEQPTGGLGFFECINDQEAANLLFDTAKNWLKERKMEAMDGPINFGEKNNFWGLLVEAKTEIMYGMSYNPPYYKELFENYGFKDYYKQYNFVYDLVNHPLPRLFELRSQRIKNRLEYKFTTMLNKDYDKYAEDFRIIYNAAWGNSHYNFKPMDKEQSRSIMNQLKPILDPKLLFFGYCNDEPVAMFLMIPEMNQVFKHFKGNLNLYNKLRFLYLQKVKKINHKACGIVFGVHPEHQKIGVEAALIKYAEEVLRGEYKQYDTMEMQWIAEFNPKMIRVVEALEIPKSKTRITYRYLFDREKEFERHPIV